MIIINNNPINPYFNEKREEIISLREGTKHISQKE